MGESKQNNRFLNQTILIPKNFFNVKRDVYSSLMCSVRHIIKRKKYAFVKFSRISQHGKWICFKGVRINHTFPVHQLVLFVVLHDRNSIVLRISDNVVWFSYIFLAFLFQRVFCLIQRILSLHRFTLQSLTFSLMQFQQTTSIPLRGYKSSLFF